MKFNSILLFVDILIGFYFINLGFNFVNLSFFDSIKQWIMLAGGILIIINGFIAMRTAPRRY